MWRTGAPDGMSARKKIVDITYKYLFRNNNTDVREPTFVLV